MAYNMISILYIKYDKVTKKIILNNNKRTISVILEFMYLRTSDMATKAAAYMACHVK